MDLKDLMADEVEDMEKDIEKTNKASEAIDQENQSEVEDTTENEDASEEVYEEDTASEDGSKEKKSFFKKKEKKDKKDEKIDELTDRLMRNMAEFENFRKRTEKEKSQMFEIGAKDIIERILPVIDNFERGLAAVTIEEKESAFVQGIEKIYKQLVTTLEAAGVKQIEAVGKEFDPDFHNAVMHSEDEEYGENIVSEEFQKGYMYRESVVRHSMVKVVN
ncbi:MAG TPA: nucleotide exchange factor GrpE [Lachnoclostridium phytofermentans]|uniref:Protein GrpE n=3 Tax=Lachnoclostridium TaxID=1506553 RepID=A0A3D2X717_9FIRM|nr:nucleotide exchange factor GrpE [Lachnoclostridium sp.]HCL02911.1 nucleotide exchange factor GrpE [Lachnoclostridium phytofermentans]